MTQKKIAVVLSGSGVYDGSEIHEATATLYAIASNGASYQIFAPDVDQHHVINHITGEEMQEKRNVLVESARIARGDVKPLSDYKPSDFDALMMPGGFGAAKNLSSVAFEGANASVNADVAASIKSTVEAGKPVGALCIAPAVVAKVLEGVEVTIGSDEGTISAIEGMGSKHKTTTHGEVVVDERFKVATTPCYMLDANIVQIFDGAQNVTKAVLEMA